MENHLQDAEVKTTAQSIGRVHQSFAGMAVWPALDPALTAVQYLAALRPETRPKTTQSRRELPPRRFLPCTPPMASPATKRPGTTLLSVPKTSAPSFILRPPMQ